MKIILTGDISFDWLPQPGLFRRLISFKSKLNYQTDIISAGLSSLFKTADLLCANLECALTDRGEPLAGKRFTMRADPHYLGALKKLNISLVCLANNHILDYGPDGLDDTIHNLKDAGIGFCGLKNKTDRSNEPYIYDDGSAKVAIFNYVDPNIIDPDPQIFFQYDRHPIPLESEKIVEDIKRFSKDHAVVIIPHWGEEWSFQQNERQQELAHRFIDSGACAVVGHHSHLAGYVEEYKNRLIAYNLGNLYMMLPDFSALRAKRRLAVELDIDKNTINSHKLIPLTSDPDSTPIPDSDIVSESYYKNYWPAEFPPTEKVIFDSLEKIKSAEVILEASDQRFTSEWQDKFHNDREVIQGKIPLAPGWRIKEKSWCGTIGSREFMGDNYLNTNVSHLFDNTLLINKFDIEHPLSKLHLTYGFPEWFYFFGGFACPEFKLVLNDKEIFNLNSNENPNDWSRRVIDVASLSNMKNKLEIIVNGIKKKYSYICWRIVAE